MSMAISWAKKVQLAKCDISVGFPKSSHIYSTYVCALLKQSVILRIKVAEGHLKIIKSDIGCGHVIIQQ